MMATDQELEKRIAALEQMQRIDRKHINSMRRGYIPANKLRIGSGGTVEVIFVTSPIADDDATNVAHLIVDPETNPVDAIQMQYQAPEGTAANVLVTTDVQAYTVFNTSVGSGDIVGAGGTTTVNYLAFIGDDKYPDNLTEEFGVRCESSGTGGNNTITIYDVDNTNTLATITVSQGASDDIYTTTSFSNIPASGEVRLETRAVVPTNNTLNIKGAYWVRYK
jgi:hypothetical protein